MIGCLFNELIALKKLRVDIEAIKRGELNSSNGLHIPKKEGLEKELMVSICSLLRIEIERRINMRKNFC